MTPIFLIVRDEVQDGDSYLFLEISFTLDAAQKYAQGVVDQENADRIDEKSSPIDHAKAITRLDWRDRGGSYWRAEDPLTGDVLKIYKRYVPAKAGET